MYLTEKSHLYSFLTGLVILLLLLVIYIISFLRQYKNRIAFFRLQVIRDMHLIEEERKRIALDLHDDLGSVLATVRMGLESIQKLIPGEAVVQETLHHLNHSLERVKAISQNLVPHTLNESGLVAAIKELLEELDSPILKCSLQVCGSDKGFATDKSLILFRVVQEVLTNVVKHAKATEVTLLLTIDNRNLLLTLKDNGIGFDPKRAGSHKSCGISNIRSRLNLLSANHTIDSSSTKGTAYTIQVPVSILTQT